jgi:hypothetical protein
MMGPTEVTIADISEITLIMIVGGNYTHIEIQCMDRDICSTDQIAQDGPFDHLGQPPPDWQYLSFKA